jgi:hypothetical protein
MKQEIVKLLVMLVFLSNSAFAQEAYNTDEGEVKIIGEELLEEIHNKRVNTFFTDSLHPGFRVQVYSGTDRNQANEIMQMLQHQWPDYGVYLRFDAPNFKVRIGDFKSRLQAQYIFNLLATDYPNLFLVPEKVNPK